MKIVIVGAGPVGCFAAEKLALSGHNVSVFEEHSVIGRPVACTGIVTKTLFDFVGKGDYIVNKLKKVDVVSPSGKKVSIPLDEFVICREKFDNFLMRKAVRAGANFFLEHKFLGFSNNVAVFKNKDKTVKFPFDILIGADGPFSSVGKCAGLVKKRRFLVGNQATIRGSFNRETFSAFFGRNVAPNFFAWAVPESEKVCRVGLASEKGSSLLFEKLRKMFPGKIIERQAGPIPVFQSKKFHKNNVFLVGDAAGMVKNTTGGGIITGLWSADILAGCINSKKSYSRALSPLLRELQIHAKLRRMLNRFSDSDYENLINYMSSPKVKSVLHNYPREFPSQFLLKLVIARPKLLRFVKYVFA